MLNHGLVFDVDDTLYLERDYVRSGYSHLETWCQAELGLKGVGDRAWQLFLHGLRGTTVSRAFGDLGINASDGLIARCISEYRNHTPEISMLGDARALLQAALGQVLVGVVTDGPERSQRAKCEALGLFEIASRVVITAELGSMKPDPRVFLAAVDGWGCKPHELMYVADNPTKDFQGPLSLGWKVVRVRRVGALHVDLPTPAGVVEVESLSMAYLMSLFDW